MRARENNLRNNVNILEIRKGLDYNGWITTGKSLHDHVEVYRDGERRFVSVNPKNSAAPVDRRTVQRRVLNDPI